jgi:hypothetical protein
LHQSVLQEFSHSLDPYKTPAMIGRLQRINDGLPG